MILKRKEERRRKYVEGKRDSCRRKADIEEMVDRKGVWILYSRAKEVRKKFPTEEFKDRDGYLFYDAEI